MGAIHRYDLTMDVTHLVVGRYDTPKYRYVAKERPDIRPMKIEWIAAVRELWIGDKEIDIEALERQHLLPTFHSLKFSMTGCNDRTRQWLQRMGLYANDSAATERLEIAEQVKTHGAIYEGDLTKQITHLISFRTEGAKYRAAKSWGLRIVSIEWLRDSIERGMILDENLYDPTLPPEERGKDAWDRTKLRRMSPGKRLREGSPVCVGGGKRKLRRTASTKFSSQNHQIWGDIVRGGSMVLQVARSGIWDAADGRPSMSLERKSAGPPANPLSLPNVADFQTGVFGGCRFYFHGFNKSKEQILRNHLLPQGAEVANTLDDLFSPTKGSYVRIFRVVPSNLSVSNHPTLPTSDAQVETITEWWLERCLHHKIFLDPMEHIIGRPFPVFPIPEFKEMNISSAAFSGIDLLHVTRAIELLGANYSEVFTKHSSMLLTKTTAGLRKDKLDAAREWSIPIVDANWLWDSIEAGTRLPLQKYRFRDQKPHASPRMGEKPFAKELQFDGCKIEKGRPLSNSGKTSSTPAARPPLNATLDNNASITDEPVPALAKSEVASQELQLQAQASNFSDLSRKSEPLTEINLNSPTRADSTEQAPSDHPNLVPREDISNAISDLLAKTKSTTALPVHNDAPEGRKRGRILGRAASNASVSGICTPFSRSTSVDSTATHGHLVECLATFQSNSYSPANGPYTDAVNAGRRSANERIKKFLAEGNGSTEEDELPPSTQLLYEDPESREYKERVMARLLGEKIDEEMIRGRRKSRVATISSGDAGQRPKRRGRPPAVGGFR
jgi:DNA replication regulator DPB11